LSYSDFDFFSSVLVVVVTVVDDIVMAVVDIAMAVSTLVVIFMKVSY
jgi:hypothetical protein